MSLTKGNTKWVLFLSSREEPEPRHVLDLAFGLYCLESAGIIQSNIKPSVEWWVMNRDETGICMFFHPNEYQNPEESCKDWLLEQRKEWVEANGYHPVKKETYTDAEDLALKAADMILKLLNEKDNKE